MKQNIRIWGWYQEIDNGNIRLNLMDFRTEHRLHIFWMLKYSAVVARKHSSVIIKAQPEVQDLICELLRSTESEESELSVKAGKRFTYRIVNAHEMIIWKIKTVSHWSDLSISSTEYKKHVLDTLPSSAAF